MTSTRTGSGSGSVSVLRVWFRRVAHVEGVSYLVLFAALLNRLLLDGPNLSPVLGPIHGVIFLVYLALAFRLRDLDRWPTARTAATIGAAIIPFGTFYVVRAHPDPPT